MRTDVRVRVLRPLLVASKEAAAVYERDDRGPFLRLRWDVDIQDVALRRAIAHVPHDLRASKSRPQSSVDIVIQTVRELLIGLQQDAWEKGAKARTSAVGPVQVVPILKIPALIAASWSRMTSDMGARDNMSGWTGKELGREESALKRAG